jgi:hypothetical protein
MKDAPNTSDISYIVAHICGVVVRKANSESNFGASGRQRLLLERETRATKDQAEGQSLTRSDGLQCAVQFRASFLISR